MRALEIREISEETVRRLARIIGPSSAAQEALDSADKERASNRAVRFLRIGDSIVVESSPKATP